MLGAFGRAFKTPDLRRKLLFTLAVIVIYRAGTFVPAPGVDYGNVQQCIAMGGTTGGIYDMVNLFSGGALLQLSIFALGVMPYITASIIVQLLRVVIPRFQELHEEGGQGQQKLTQYTRYLTMGLALLNATTIISLARSGALLGNCPLPVIPDDSIIMILVIIVTLTAEGRALAERTVVPVIAAEEKAIRAFGLASAEEMHRLAQRHLECLQREFEKIAR